MKRRYRTLAAIALIAALFLGSCATKFDQYVD